MLENTTHIYIYLNIYLYMSYVCNDICVHERVVWSLIQNDLEMNQQTYPTICTRKLILKGVVGSSQ